MGQPVTVRPVRAAGRLGRRTALWAGTWLVATAVNLGILLSQRQLDQPPSAAKGSVAIVMQLVATVVLLRWLGRVPTDSLTAAPQTRRGLFALAVVLSVLALFPMGFARFVVLPAVGVAAVVVLLALRYRPSTREVMWALTLGVLAAGAGVVEWLASSSGLAEALAQAPLVLVTLLAGWAIARRTGWEDAGIGRSTFVSEGWVMGLRDFGLGFLLAAPWAFGNIATGPFEEDNYQAVWLVLAAFRPGVAEEACGRVFVITALYWAFRRCARAQPALLSA